MVNDLECVSLTSTNMKKCDLGDFGELADFAKRPIEQGLHSNGYPNNACTFA